MHPDLLNNSLFLRYYRQWQQEPDSIVFAAIADYLLRYQLIDDAFRVCSEGLKRHPALVSGRMVMAKIALAKGNLDQAEEEIRAILKERPTNGAALGILAQIALARAPQNVVMDPPPVKAEVEREFTSRERIDRYIPPETQETALPRLTQQTWKPVRWVQSILARKKITEEAAELIAKVEKLSFAPEISLRYFFDNDLPRLVSLSRLQPALIQKMLRDKETKDPWFRLVQVACGDASAILPALDSLC